MKWPPRWLLGSPRDSSGAAGAAPASDPPGARQPEPAPSPAGWAFLPPLQRTIGAAPSTTRPTSFPLTLPAWGNPSFTGRMTHAVTDAAPSGVIDGDGGGIGTPTERTPSFELPLAPPAPAPSAPRVQRSLATGAPAPIATRAPAPDAATLTSAGRAAAPVLTVAAEPADAVAPDVPLPELPLPELPLAAAPPPGPAPPQDAPAELLGIDNGGATFVDVPPAAASTPVVPSVAPAPAGDAAPPLALQRSAVPAERVDPARPRRGGLGAPLSPDAAGAAVQRSTVEGPPRRLPLAQPAPQAAPDRSTLQPSFQPGMPSPARPEEPARAEAPALPAVQRSAEPLPAATPEPPRAAADLALPMPTQPASESVPGQPAADATGPSVTAAPLLGEGPVLTGPQSSATPGVPAPGALPVPQPLARPPAPVQRAGPDATASSDEAAADSDEVSAGSASVVPDEPAAAPDSALPLATPAPAATGEEPVLGERMSATTDAHLAAPADPAAAVQVAEPATAPQPALPVATPIQRSTTLLGERPVQRLVTPDLLPPPAAPTPRAAVDAAAVRPAVRATFLDPTQELPVVHDSITTATAYREPAGGPAAGAKPAAEQAAPGAVQRSVHAASAPDVAMPGAGPAVQRAVAVAPARTAPSVPGLVHAPVPTAGSPGSPALGHGSRRSVTPDRTIAADPVLALPVQRAVQIDELSTTPAAPDTAAPGATATDPAPTTSAQDAAAGGTPGAGDSAGAPAAAGGAGGATSEDMDALARKLVEPLTRRLRAEMLIERERRGVRSDAR